jgi:hypothetical protein
LTSAKASLEIRAEVPKESIGRKQTIVFAVLARAKRNNLGDRR